MKRFFLIVLAAVCCLSSCKTSRTYADAERAFRQSLTADDTLEVLIMGQNFMESLVARDFDSAFEDLSVLYDGVLYRASDKWKSELKSRYSVMCPTEYALSSYMFSTPGINDLVYRYSIGTPLSNQGPAFKLALNPVKVEGSWYLTIKDSEMASEAADHWDEMYPDGPAPAEPKLNRKSETK